MKDAAHHLKNVQRKVIRTSRREQELGLNNYQTSTNNTSQVKSPELNNEERRSPKASKL